MPANPGELSRLVLAAALVIPQVAHAADDSAGTALDDCLAKAVAKQATGRPITPLLRDLFNSCHLEVVTLEGELIRRGLTNAQATDEAYWKHFAPAALRASPIRNSP
jgi:hypothetical protein